MMITKKPKIKAKSVKAVTLKKVKGKKGSMAQKDAQAKIKKVSKIATEIQKEGGQKVVTKKVYKIKRSDAVKKAWKKIN
ncbi:MULTISPECIES: hypothetical protein [unclassified Arcicella]|uniref:hypothetical protein n=1 Tax=unclassified Arcicella TaxID=2644986 RepID=UPI00285F7157|nr:MULTISPECIES: hypothetical protein [unclassified Arcicella]MDR6564964.1 hypothetical protein [Arcicella sp. BE51]MDR6814754.1 hypothetical protein [Arcicella sp. BE140]MDR6826200.1 hypothetical protein [Arcicella sp. BE139]